MQTNPCAEINLSVVAPKGTIAVMMDGDAGHVMFDGDKWLRVSPYNDDVTKLNDIQLYERLEQIEKLFKLCEELRIEGIGLVDLNAKANEFNKVEEELISRYDVWPAPQPLPIRSWKNE